MNITSNGRNIGQVLTAGYYKIPRFQRPYSWDQSNVEDFWTDILESPLNYFIGSMVVYPSGSSGDTYGLVDGQQRLTTITILLAALRNELNRVGGNNEATGLQTMIERVDLQAQRRFVLQTETSYPYLQAAIQSEPGTARQGAPAGAEEQALKRAFDLFSLRVRGLTDAIEKDLEIQNDERISRSVEKLRELRNKVLGLSLVLIEVDDEDDATAIFQTLNSRGKDLEVADLAKSHVLSLLKSTNVDLDQSRDAWNSMIDSFDKSAADLSMNRFLLHYWLSKYGFLGEKDLFRAIKAYVRVNNAQDFLDDLVENAELYRTAQEPSYRTWKKPQAQIQQTLEALVLFRLRQPLPMILSLLREYDAENIRLKVLMRGLKAIENYHFIATAVSNQPSSGGISRMYASAARNLLSAPGAEKKNAVIEDLEIKLRGRLPSYAEFEASFLELRSSKHYTQQVPLVRYVLTRLHAGAVDPENTSPVDYSRLTVEHLAPQSGRRGSSGIQPSDVAKVGNLLLVTEQLNGRLGDLPFSEKQEILRGQKDMEPEILQARNWGAREIEARTKRMARKSYNEVWKF